MTPERGRARRFNAAATRLGVGLALLLGFAAVGAIEAAAGEQWGWLGVRIRDLTEQEAEELTKRLGIREGYGVLIAQVMKDTPAEAAGMRDGDLVVAIDGRPIVETRALQRLVGAAPAGREVALVVLRERERQELRVRVGRMPPDVVADRLTFEFGFFVRDGTEERTTPQPAAPQPDLRAPVVAGVAERSSAARAGLLAGDLILTVNDVEVDTVEAFRLRTQDLYLKDPLRLRVLRQGERLTLTLPPVQASRR